MNKDNLESYKQKLEKEKNELLSQIKIDQESVDFGDDTTDPLDEEADEAEELGNELAVESVLKNRLNQIDAALNKIDSGTYGMCENCGSAISEHVLNVAPESSLCENCKQRNS